MPARASAEAIDREDLVRIDRGHHQQFVRHHRPVHAGLAQGAVRLPPGPAEMLGERAGVDHRPLPAEPLPSERRDDPVAGAHVQRRFIRAEATAAADRREARRWSDHRNLADQPPAGWIQDAQAQLVPPDEGGHKLVPDDDRTVLEGDTKERVCRVRTGPPGLLARAQVPCDQLVAPA